MERKRQKKVYSRCFKLIFITLIPFRSSWKSNVGEWFLDFAESLGNIENLEQLKAEVKKRYFLISFFFFPINFTYFKVDNYAFSIKL